MTRIAVAVVALFLVWARPAIACVPAFERAIIDAPQFEPAGAVTVTGESVDVSCNEAYACDVTSTFAVVVSQPARVTVNGEHITELTFGAELSPGQSRFEMRARVDVVPFVDGCTTDGVIARHPYMGSARASNEHVLQIDTTTKPRLNVPSSWDVDVDTREATKYGPATTRLWFTVPGRRVTHGGPLLLIGANTGDGNTFRVRGGWEVAIGKPWLVVGVTAETDFADAWNVALTAEPTSPGWTVPITFGAGGGVVLANGSRVGGRGLLSIALGPARIMFSVDVFRDGATFTALVGGSL